MFSIGNSCNWVKPSFPTSSKSLSLSITIHKSINKHLINCSFHKTITKPNTTPTTFTSHTTIIRPNTTISTPNKTINTPKKSFDTLLNWNLFQKVAALLLDVVAAELVEHESRSPLPKTADPSVQLAGNFAPVPEHPLQQNLLITGIIPDCMDGVYVRNGANPLHASLSGHHLFDGDGMIHAIKFDSGSASYCCRFTETNRLVQERELGRAIFPKSIGELHGHSGIARLMLFHARGLLGLVDGNKGIGVANAGLVYFNGRLLAMSEDDLPYHIRVTPLGGLETVGRYNFSDQLSSSMIAHPKLDPVSGELFSLSYDIVKKPYLKYFWFSPNGEKSPDVEIPLACPTMIHDFAITKNFVIVPDQQVVFKLPEMIRGGSPMVYDSKKVSRFGILGRYATDSSEMRWVEVPDCFCFHLWNAWDELEIDEVVVIGSCMTPADSIFNDRDEDLRSVLSEIRLNLKTGKSTRRSILNDPDQVNLEAGMVNRYKLSCKSQFAYLAIVEPWPKVSGFAKVNLSTGQIKKYIYGDNKYGGEPMFVPREKTSDIEDDGFILAYVHDEENVKSELRMIDAISMELEATVTLPSRVPYGFHGTFINAVDLANQV